MDVAKQALGSGLRQALYRGGRALRHSGRAMRHSGRASLRASRVPMPARTEPRPPFANVAVRAGRGLIGCWLFIGGCFSCGASGHEPHRVVVDAHFPGAYQVEVADVNGDNKPDIIAVGGSTCAWYENPTWKKRVVTGPGETPGVISSATADVDGDGKAEIAIAYEFGMNTPTKGKLLLAAQGKGLDEPWTLKKISDIGSIHRLRWGHVEGRDGLDLIIAPIFGADAKPPGYQQSAATILRYPARRAPKQEPSFEKLSSRFVLHAIEVIDVTGDGLADILTADNGGVQLITREPGDAGHGDATWRKVPLVAGAAGNPPKRGCSEVHLGRAGGSRFLATIEPWHGTQVVVYKENDTGLVKLWSAHRHRRHAFRRPCTLGRRRRWRRRPRDLRRPPGQGPSGFDIRLRSSWSEMEQDRHRPRYRGPRPARGRHRWRRHARCRCRRR